MRKQLGEILRSLANRLAPPKPVSITVNGVTHQRKETFVSIPANLIQCNPNPLDFQLLLGEIDRSHGQATALWSAAVTTSWQHAKLLCLFLAAHVDIYETATSAIIIPEEIRPEFLSPAAARLSLKQMGQAVVAAAAPTSTVQ